jgi:hypothetical protein
MRKPEGPIPGCGYLIVLLEKIVEGKQTVRPLVQDLSGYTISNLRRLHMLNPGQNTRFETGEGSSITTRCKCKYPKFEIRQGRLMIWFYLISKPFGNGLSWFFLDPNTGRPVKSIFMTEHTMGGRKEVRAVYASQYQGKIYRKLIRMEKLLHAIQGRYRGPARGKSKLRKLVNLRRVIKDVDLADRLRDKVLVEYPQFERTIRVAKEVLKYEVKRLPKGWDKIENHQTDRKTEAAPKVFPIAAVPIN